MTRATRRSLGILLIALAPLGSCGNAALDAPAEEPPVPVDMADDDDQILTAGPDLLEPVWFGTVTYDGSGELVHPDAVVLPHGWRGRRFWFAATPYPRGNPNFENPSLFQGDAADEWEVPAGATNPLALPEARGYLSDPDLLIDPVRGELRLYYRQTTPNADHLYLITSRDGVRWSQSQRVLEAALYDLISPAVVRLDHDSWRMWTVGAHDGGCRAAGDRITLWERRSLDGIRWGEASRVQLAIPGRVPWHWDVQYIKAKREYWALVVAYRDGGTCSESQVYFARSGDGTTWTVSPAPLLAPRMLPRLDDLVYRSTFRYFSKSDMVDVWFSGARLEGGIYHYALAMARYPFAELLARVERDASAGTSRTGEGRTPSADERAARERFADAFP